MSGARRYSGSRRFLQSVGLDYHPCPQFRETNEGSKSRSIVCRWLIEPAAFNPVNSCISFKWRPCGLY